MLPPFSESAADAEDEVMFWRMWLCRVFCLALLTILSIACASEATQLPASSSSTIRNITHGDGNHHSHHHSVDEGIDLTDLIPDLSFSVDVVAGKLIGTLSRFEANLGDLVEANVTSEADDELHLHAYDMTTDLRAGITETLRFYATIPGVFEAELHRAGFVIFELTVS